MPEPEQTSWADEIAQGDSTSLPATTEKILGDKKIVTSFKINDKGNKVKVVRTYNIEKKIVPKSIARRKAWPKFGLSKDDRPGPNPMTTIVAEEIFMQFVANKEEDEKNEEQSALDKIKAQAKGVVKCRICKEDHWTSNCPYKDTLGPLRDSLVGKEAGAEDGPAPGGPGGPGPAGAAMGMGGPGGKYVPPSKRDGAGRLPGGDSMPDRRRTEDTAAIRVSNLPEFTRDTDLQDLFKPFGHIARIFLAKDKATGNCKGFAFINYSRKEDAAKAIATLDGFAYDHLILHVEWAKPSGS